MVNNNTIIHLLVILPNVISIVVTLIVFLVTNKTFHNKKLKYLNDNNKTGAKKTTFLKIFILVLIYIIVNLISCNIILFIDRDYNQKFDIFGNEYSSQSDILLYDGNGKSYIFVDGGSYETSYFIGIDSIEHPAESTYLTEGGYIVFLDSKKIVNYIGIYEIEYEDGEHYYAALRPYWNSEGTLIVDNDAKILITKEQQLEYQKTQNVPIYKMCNNSLSSK